MHELFWETLQMAVGAVVVVEGVSLLFQCASMHNFLLIWSVEVKPTGINAAHSAALSSDSSL